MGDSRKKWEEMEEQQTKSCDLRENEAIIINSKIDDTMLKLTALHYKIKSEALEIFHNITQHNDGRMFEWEAEFEKQRSLGGEYPEKPFIEPFEFQDSDYNMTEKRFRVRPEDVFLYKENADNVTELTVSDGTIFTIKETVEELDLLLNNEFGNPNKK